MDAGHTFVADVEGPAKFDGKTYCPGKNSRSSGSGKR